MRSALSVVSVVSLLVASSLVACTQTPASSTPAPVQVAAPVTPASTQVPVPAGRAGAMSPEQLAARNDSLQKDRQMHVDRILKQIAGKEALPAEEV